MKKQRMRRDAGAGSIYQEGDGWRVKFQLPNKDLSTGKPKIIKKRAKTKEEANRILRELMAASYSGNLKPSCTQTLTEYLLNWVETVVRSKNSPGTYTSYLQAINRFISTNPVGRKKLSEVTTRDLQQLFGKLAKTPIPKLQGTPKEGECYSRRQIEIVRAVVNIGLNYAVNVDQVINTNPVRGAVIPRIARKPDRKQSLTAEELAKLLTALDPHDPYGRIILFMLGTATRVGEAIGLCWDCVDFDRRTVVIKRQLQRSKGSGMILVDDTKTGQRRIIALPDSIYRMLSELKQSVETGNADSDADGVVFLNHVGGRMESQGVSRRLKTICDRVGIPRISPHILRHTSATIMLEGSGDLHAASRVLGHKNTKLTSDIYGHLLDERRTKMASILEQSLQSKS